MLDILAISSSYVNDFWICRIHRNCANINGPGSQTTDRIDRRTWSQANEIHKRRPGRARLNKVYTAKDAAIGSPKKQRCFSRIVLAKGQNANSTSNIFIPILVKIGISIQLG